MAVAVKNTMVGIVYGMVDRSIHMIIKPDLASALDDKRLVKPGEIMVRMVRSTYELHNSHQNLAYTLGLVG